ncbi:MAG: hypothetical protein H6709_24770 [Kofleriaceae bacterium]|nr:hypothetical protein [Myxococcales bacterium]MCB9561787.1 hypothetical protein [Kofleriaceae bacterium]MCB9575302.1 hypothetical protein [Kofleriaceae bacterium]
MTALRTSLFAVAVALVGAASLARADGDRPRHPDGPPPCHPPPEAVAACDGADVGDPCDFDAPHGNVEGTCRVVGEEQVLACVPRDAPPPRPPRKDGDKDRDHRR